MKIFCLLVLIISLGTVFTCNKIKLTSYEIAYNDTEGNYQKLSFRFKNHTLAFHTLDETNISSTIIKLIWEFSSPAEVTKAQEILTKISPYFEETKMDDAGLLINFFGYHMVGIKNFRKSEFGTFYRFEILQKGQSVEVAVMMQKNDPNIPMFDEIINKLLPQPDTPELKFLA